MFWNNQSANKELVAKRLECYRTGGHPYNTFSIIRHSLKGSYSNYDIIDIVMITMSDCCKNKTFPIVQWAGRPVRTMYRVLVDGIYEQKTSMIIYVLSLAKPPLGRWTPWTETAALLFACQRTGGNDSQAIAQLQWPAQHRILWRCMLSGIVIQYDDGGNELVVCLRLVTWALADTSDISEMTSPTSSRQPTLSCQVVGAFGGEGR